MQGVLLAAIAIRRMVTRQLYNNPVKISEISALAGKNDSLTISVSNQAKRDGARTRTLMAPSRARLKCVRDCRMSSRAMVVNTASQPRAHAIVERVIS